MVAPHKECFANYSTQYTQVPHVQRSEISRHARWNGWIRRKGGTARHLVLSGRSQHVMNYEYLWMTYQGLKDSANDGRVWHPLQSARTPNTFSQSNEFRVALESFTSALLSPLRPLMWERQRKVKRNYSLCLNDSEWFSTAQFGSNSSFLP